ncbi:helix-turn-helix domain-containing protein [Aquabacterium sp.]|uniref:helix-turn-helix domain-containing protein n=1 Tax=Aquabacterium sp. TaxID=1872578 RepID=UPI003785262F
MQYALALIDKALERCQGNASAVARLAGIKPQSLHDIRHGKLKMSPETAAILAAAIGDDPEYSLKRVMLENATGEKLARLQKAFRVAAGVAGAAVLAAMAAAPSDSSAGTIRTDRDAVQSARPEGLHALYIVAHLLMPQ